MTKIPRYQQNLCCAIRSAIETNEKVILINGPKNVGKNFCVQLLKEDYEITNTFKNINTAKEFLMELQACCNPNKLGKFALTLSLSALNSKIPFALPIMDNINSIINIFKPDTIQTTDIIKTIIDKLCSINKVYIPIYYDCEPCLEIVNLYKEILSYNNNLKIIFINSCKNSFFFNEISQSIRLVSLYLELNAKDIEDIYADRINVSTVSDIISMCQHNTGEIIKFLDYIDNSCDLSQTSVTVAQYKIEELTKDLSESMILKYAALFEDYFTREELVYIFKELTFNYDVLNGLDEYLDLLKAKKVLTDNDGDLSILLDIFKQLLKNKTHHNKDYTINIEKCLKKYRPFDYEYRYNFLQERECKNRADIVALLWHLHNLRFSIDDNKILLDGINRFSDYLKSLIKAINKIYALYKNAYYIDALYECSLYESIEQKEFKDEIDYIIGLCEWKLNGNTSLDSHNTFEYLFKDAEEPEIRIFSGMTLLSINANNAQNLKSSHKVSNKIFHSIINSLHENSECEQLIKFIMYRKSPAIYDYVACLENTKDSYLYFLQHSLVYPTEYLMAKNNYIAVLINLGNYDAAYNLIKNDFLENNCISNRYTAYLFHNYLLSKTLCGESFDKKDLNEYIRYANGPADQDYKIMAFLFAATYYAQIGDINNANNFFKCLEKLIEANDDYYLYILSFNMGLFYYLRNEFDKAKEKFDIALNIIPALFKPLEKQYIRHRNKVMCDILQLPNHLNYDELKAKFSFEKTPFLANNNNFYSQPYLYTDIQFWTEN